LLSAAKGRRLLRSRWTIWLLILTAWLVLAAMHTTMNYSLYVGTGQDTPWTEIARRYFAIYAVWGAVLTPIVLWLCARFRLSKDNWKSALAVHLAAVFAVAALNAALRSGLDPFVYPALDRPLDATLVLHYFLNNAAFDVVMYFMVAGLYHGVHYHRRYRDRALAAAQLEAQLARAELQSLTMQLQPHFLFNTLHSISALMHRDIKAADRMMVRLSDLLRLTLDNIGLHEVPLKRELEFLNGYLEIEQARFQDRLVVHTEIDPETLDAAVPNLLLQPLVENAVRHGVARRSEPGRIEITARRQGPSLALAVRDDGPGDHSAEPLQGQRRLGLRNVRTRLEALYGRRHAFRIEIGPQGGWEVAVEIPFLPASTEQAPDVLTETPDARPSSIREEAHDPARAHS
jgi:two-component system, LytTR family, sensor kinase